jgi:hypothetical protein
MEKSREARETICPKLPCRWSLLKVALCLHIKGDHILQMNQGPPPYGFCSCKLDLGVP